jgi:hypothetical protein
VAVAEPRARTRFPGVLARPGAVDDAGDSVPVTVERRGAGCELEAAAVGWGRVGGAVAGLNVATESIAPATRHTARMLASSGKMVACPAKGDVSRRSLPRLRRARSSRR